MSAYSRYRQNIENKYRNLGNQPPEDPSYSSFSDIPADQSSNIYNDKIRENYDEIAQGVTAPFTAVGSVHLAGKIGSQVLKRVPFLNKIKEAYGASQEVQSKVNALLGRDDVKSFLEDPEGTFKRLAGPIQDKFKNLLDSIPESGEELASKLGSKVAESIKSGVRSSLGFSEATPEASAASESAEEAPGMLERIKGAISDRIFGSSQPAEPQSAEDAQFDKDFQSSLDQDEPKTLESKVAADEDYADSDFKDALTGNESVLEQSRIARAGRVDQVADLKENIMKNIRGEPSEGGGGGGSGEQLDLQRAMGEIRTNVKPITSEEADVSKLESTVGDLKDTTSTITKVSAEDAATQIAEKIGETGADELGVGLGIADVIPVVGTIFDLATIGAMIGESVDSYNNKAKEAKDEEKEQERQSALEKQVSNQQSQIVDQVRSQPIQQQSQQAQNNPVPVSQVIRDPR